MNRYDRFILLALSVGRLGPTAILVKPESICESMQYFATEGRGA